MVASERTYWIDALRAIAILLVVFGHTSGVENSSSLRNYIFSFHMPLFFLISGLVLKREELYGGFPSYVGRQVRTLLVPYLFFGLLTYIPWVLFFRHYGHGAALDPSPVGPLLGILYGNGQYLYSNVPLWFFPCLFVTRVMFFWLARLERKPLIAIALALFAVIGYSFMSFTTFRMPWSIDIAFTATVFFGTGYLLRSSSIVASPLRTFHAIPILIVSLALHLVSRELDSVGQIGMGFYHSLPLFYLGAFSGIIFWGVVSKCLPTSNLISLIGRSTLVIFSLHILVFSLITGAKLFVLGLPLEAGEHSLPVAFLYLVACVLVLLPVAWAFRRYLPWAVGSRA